VLVDKLDRFFPAQLLDLLGTHVEFPNEHGHDPCVVLDRRPLVELYGPIDGLPRGDRVPELRPRDLELVAKDPGEASRTDGRRASCEM
jgi:hypothetical protein